MLRGQGEDTADTTMRAMLAVIACGGLAGLTFGYTLPLLSIIMEKDGIGSMLIGLSAAAESAAILLFGPLVPKLFHAAGLRRAMFAAIALGALTVGSLAFVDPLYAWFPLRFVLGGAIFTLFIASDVWVTQGAGPKKRGRMIAIYGTVITAGIAAGPLLVPITGTSGWTPFAVCTGLFVLAAVPLLLAFGPAPGLESGARPGIRVLLTATPVLVAGVLAFGLLDASVLSLLPIYGLHSGMSEQDAVLLVTILVAGSIILQFPIGWLTDRTEKMRVLLACAVLGAAAAAPLSLAIGTPWALWACLFVMGGAMVGIYIVSLAILGDRYSGGALAMAISVFAMVLSAGSTVGPIGGGGAMRLWDPHGLNAVILGAFLLPVAAAIVARLVRPGAPRRA